MSVMYSVACLLELDGKRGKTIFDDHERDLYWGWIDEWAEWVMNDLPSGSLGCVDKTRQQLISQGLSAEDFSIVSVLSYPC
jgi:hypothetical protein